jgi:hypothetical protein
MAGHSTLDLDFKMNKLLFPFLPTLVLAMAEESPPQPAEISEALLGPFTYSRPDTQDQISVSAELLYWSLSELGLEGAFYKDYIVIGSGETGFNTGNGTTGPQGTILQKSFGWHPGYRLSAGYSLSNSFYFLYGDYTYFHFYDAHTYNSDLGNFSTFQPSAMVLAQAGTPSLGRIVSLKSKFDFSYQIASFLLGVGWRPHSRITFDATLGPAAAWISQRLKHTFVGLTRIGNAFFNATYRAPGLQGGMDLTAALGEGFGIRGALSFSGLWGSGSYTFNYGYEAAPNGSLSYQNISDGGNTASSRLVTIAHFLAGCNWGYRTRFSTISLAAGYEFNVINNFAIQSRGNPNASNTASSPTSYRISPIVVHGLNIETSFAF